MTRTWSLRAGAVAFGLGLVGLAEVGMRASGLVADPSAPALPAGWEDGGVFARSDARGVIQAADIGGQPGTAVGPPAAGNQMRRTRWTTDAPLPRVFAFGGSTTLGVPFEKDPGTSFPEQLADQARAGGRPIEVLNLGGAGFSSTEVVDLGRQLAGQPAAAWVVYSGNNEFFRFSLDAWEAHRGLPSPRQNLQALHLFRALEDLLSTGPPPMVDVEAATAAQREVVANVITAGLADPTRRPAQTAEETWTRRDEAHAAVLRRYRQNLEAMERLASQAGARLYIVDIQANLLQAPWLSLHDPTVPGRVRDAVRRDLHASATARVSGDAEAARTSAQSAVAADPMHAHSWHALGLARLAGGDPDGAARALQAALDLDMDPGRPNAALQAVLHDVTADGGSTLVSLPAWRAPDQGLHGSDLFHDSCHLTQAGYAAVGQTLSEALSGLPR
jgi:hypothetical protein